MATDWWLMQQAVKVSLPSFRHYRWVKPEISFGYGQKWQWVEEEAGIPIKYLIRRPTGGGLVRHGQDWTYCLVIPNEHHSFKIPSLDLYEYIHTAIGNALAKQSIITFLQPCEVDKKAGIPGDCFHEPVGKDLMMDGNGEKIAGAAMKRTRSAILIQGTLELAHLSSFNEEAFTQKFQSELCRLLEEDSETKDWTDEFLKERQVYCDQFSNLLWRKNRERC